MALIYYIYTQRPSKTDSAPVHGDGYKPGLTQSQRRDVAQHADRTWWWLSVLGGGEKFSDGEILKTTTVGPLQFSYYTVLLPRAPI
jgi:hypothetical protein